MKMTRRAVLAMVACASTLVAGPAIASDLPSAEDLFKAHVKAIGGEEALKSQKSLTLKGQFIMPAGGIDAPITVYHLAPNKMLMKMSIPGMGDMAQGFDGTVAWGSNPMMGPMILEGAQHEQFKEQADMLSDVNFKKYYKELGTPEEVTFEGKPAYKLPTVTSTGDKKIVYFDRDSGLMVGSEGEVESEMGPMNIKTIISDYKKHGDIRFPTVVRTLMIDMGMEQTIKVNEISTDELDPDIFELPDEIKALLEEPATQ